MNPILDDRPASNSAQPLTPLNQLYEMVGSWTERPSWDDYFMAMAGLISSRSSCERLHVGCVLVSSQPHPHRLIAAGYNGFLPGLPHVSRVRDDHELGTVHAEQNALTDAARRGVSVNGATAYVTHFPCIHCAKMLVAVGVRRICFHFDYKNDPLALDILNEAGINLQKF